MTAFCRALALVVVAVSTLGTGPASADAPDPVPRSMHGSVVHHPDGSRTVTIYGGTDAEADPGWQWLDHPRDCNADRAGAGVAVAWNDPADPGTTLTAHLSGGSITLGVGEAGANVVHPTPQLDPLRPAASDVATPSEFADWRGGCGAYVDHHDTQLPDGTVRSGYWNQGTWGPLSHTYPASVTGPLTACPVLYGVGGDASGEPPSHEREVTAGGKNHNTDNSSEANGSLTGQDACFTADAQGPHLAFLKEVSADGGDTYAKSVSVEAGSTVRYRFTVTNDGTSDLEHVGIDEVTETADCAASLGADAGFDGTLLPGETVSFACDHTLGTERFVNVAKASASSSPGAVEVLSANDSAVAEIKPPELALDLVAPEATNLETPVPYTMVVTSPGSTRFAAPLAVANPACTYDAVSLVGKGGDLSPRTFDPGDVWTYACSGAPPFPSALIGDAVLHAIASVNARAIDGTSFAAEDHADTRLPVSGFEQIVLGERGPGTAKPLRLRGRTGCQTRSFLVRVSGPAVSAVTITLDGRVVRRAGAVGTKVISYRIVPRRLRFGVHRVVAHVLLANGDRRTLRLSFQRCRQRLRAPRFTG